MDFVYFWGKVNKIKLLWTETTFQAKNHALSSRSAGFGPTGEAILALWSATVAGTDTIMCTANVCMTSDFRHGANEIFALLGYR